MNKIGKLISDWLNEASRKLTKILKQSSVAVGAYCFGQTLSDWIGIVTLIIAILTLVISSYAIKVAVIAMKHADQSGDIMICELEKQLQQMEGARKLLNASSDALKDLLGQSKRQVLASHRTTDELSDQLSVNRMQSELLKQQVATAKAELLTIQKEFGRMPHVQMTSLKCIGRQEPEPKFSYQRHSLIAPFTSHEASSSDLEAGQTDFPLDLLDEPAITPCVLTLMNTGDAVANGLEIDLRLSNVTYWDIGPHGDNMRPALRGVYITNDQTQTKLSNEPFTISTGLRVPLNRVAIQAPFKLQFDYEVMTATVTIDVHGDNFILPPVRITFIINRPSRTHPASN